MLLHVVLFEPRPDLSDAARRALIASIERAATEIPVVRRFDVGRRLSDGPAYQVGAPPPLSYIAIVAVDDRAGLDAYLAHPVHRELGRLFGDSLAQAQVYDFEMSDARVADLQARLSSVTSDQ
jgi:hypothetical protein